MKKFWYTLRFAGICVGIVLFAAFIFFDIIDLIVLGDFPDWLYVVVLISWAVYGVCFLVTTIKKWRSQRKRK
jgi:hypothetical protein